MSGPAIDPQILALNALFRSFDIAAATRVEKLEPPTLMLSPKQTPTEAAVFGTPTSWTGRCAFGTLELDFVAAGAQTVKWVELRSEGRGYVLEVHLVEKPRKIYPTDASSHSLAKLVPASAVSATQCQLRATVNGVARAWDFQEYTLGGAASDRWTLVLRIAGTEAEIAAQRDAVHAAMTRSPDARVVLRRTVSIGTLALWKEDGKQPWLVFPSAIEVASPFTFDEAFDRNVFEKASGAPTPVAGGWTPHEVLWQPSAAEPPVVHAYYQDRMEPRAVYFLPDSFRLARAGVPRKPSLAAHVLDDGAKLALDYHAVPVWDAARVAAAAATLAGRPGIPPDVAALQPFRASGAALRLSVPRGDGAGGPGFAAQPAASVDTARAIAGTVTLAVEDFRAVLDALASDGSDLLTGTVSVTVAGAETAIPFVARAAQCAGPVCTYAVAPDAVPDALAVTVTNAIESPIAIAALPIGFARAGAGAGEALPSADAASPFPTTLAPGASLTLSYMALDHDAASVELHPDESRVTVQLDAAGLLDAILDPAVQTTASIQIAFRVAADAFAATAAKPLTAVQIELENSAKTLSFTRATPAAADGDWLVQTIQLPVPLRAYLLGPLAGEAAQYRYRVRRFYKGGEVVADPAFTTSSVDTVYVSA